MKVKDILSEVGMSYRSAYYSGRGATISDLDSEHLEKIHALIMEHHKEDADSNFVEMVKDIEVLSATAFIEALYDLERNNWQFVKSDKQPPQITLEKDENGNYNETKAFVALFNAMSLKDNDTERIRQPFLRKIGVPFENEIPNELMRFMGKSNSFYEKYK